MFSLERYLDIIKVLWGHVKLDCNGMLGRNQELEGVCAGNMVATGISTE